MNPQSTTTTITTPPQSVFKNRNVRLILLFSLLDGACFSVWSAQLLPILINNLAGNAAVGWSAAASGISQMIGATVAGYAGDKLPRTQLIRLGSFTGILAVAATLTAIHLFVIEAIYITQVLWGVYIGIVSTSVEALFADSILSGHRNFIYTFKWILQTVCYCVGYLVALVMLLLMGNNWDKDKLRLVMTVGLAFHPLAQILLVILRDEDAIGHNETLVISSINNNNNNNNKKENNRKLRTASDTFALDAPLIDEEDKNTEYTGQSSSLSYRNNKSPEKNNNGESSIDNTNYTRLTINNNNSSSTTTRSSNSSNSNEIGFIKECFYRFIYFFQWLFKPEGVPFLVCFTDFWMAIGSGMTVQYLTLFLVNDFSIDPTWLLGAYITISCGTAICAIILRYIGDHYTGRIPAVIGVRTIGTTFLLLLSLAKGPLAHLSIVITFFILRNAMMNSTMGVTRSVIMDCVPKATRAKWSAFESFSSFTWAGSAVIGGYIAEAKGYQFTFFITAIFHYVGIIALVPAAIALREVERELRKLKELKYKEKKEGLTLNNSDDSPPIQ